MTTPQQIEAKATEMHLAFNAMEIRTPLEDMAGAKQKLFSDFLTSFAAEVRAETMEADAKICDGLPATNIHQRDAYDYAAYIIRSKIQL